MTPTHLFFDLDGTLTDPRLGIVRCLQYALEGLGLPARPESELVSYIGPPLQTTFAGFVEGPEDPRVADGIALYRERFGTTGLYENEVYDGIPELLGRLREAGHPLFIVTSKPTVYAEKIAAHFELEPFFDAIHGPDLDGTRADKSELIAHVLQRERIAADRVLMIGDRSHDIVGATANAIRGVGVLWGYGSAAELEGAGAWQLSGSPSQLGELIANV